MLPAWQLLDMGDVGDAVLEELEHIVYAPADDDALPAGDPRVAAAARLQSRMRRR
jgi:hypothetical protein